MTTLLQKAKKAGLEVEIHRSRPVVLGIGEYSRHELNVQNRANGTDLKFSQYGGTTTVFVHSDTRSVMCQAFCSPEDRFDRRLGVTIALGRCLKILGIVL